jgi:superfamily II DNA/RNA helicase
MPKIELEYYHRVGRTGRYDAKGMAISFIREQEMNFMLGNEVKLVDLLEEMPDYEILNKYLQAIMAHTNKPISFEIDQKYNYSKELNFTAKFKGESNMTEWTTDLEQPLYDSTKFKYLPESETLNIELSDYCSNDTIAPNKVGTNNEDIDRFENVVNKLLECPDCSKIIKFLCEYSTCA